MQSIRPQKYFRSELAPASLKLADAVSGALVGYYFRSELAPASLKRGRGGPSLGHYRYFRSELAPASLKPGCRVSTLQISPIFPERISSGLIEAWKHSSDHQNRRVYFRSELAPASLKLTGRTMTGKTCWYFRSELAPASLKQ